MSRDRKTAEKGIILFLLLAILAVYGQVWQFEFVNYDDDWIITENLHLRGGLTWNNIVWAFTDSSYDWWHPLTWLSHMLDIEWFGMNPGAHHLTNLALHLGNTLLCFYVLRRMTGAVWQSGVVAALFGLHPLHVESVAWVTERKDVLSTVFWFLTMLAYLRYAERPGAGRYALVMLGFSLGLMAKPMLVTLPFVLLLLDYWPLRRTDKGWRRLVLEKLPMFALAAASSWVTFLGQRRVGGVTDTAVYPLAARAGNALLSYGSYLKKMVWPGDLAVFYPFPEALPAWQVASAAALVLTVTAGVFAAARARPYLLVGWLWFLGTLFPVIGLVQVGDRAMADRFTYVPLIGVFLMLAWGLPDILAQWRHRRLVLRLVTVIALTACMATTWLQVRTWRDSVALFQHAARVTKQNPVVLNNLGTALAARGEVGEAMKCFREALWVSPGYPPAHSNLGLALAKQGRLEEAIVHYRQALQAQPTYLPARYNLGVALLNQRKLEQSIAELKEVTRQEPDHQEARDRLAEAQYLLALELARDGRHLDAIPGYLEAVRFIRDDAKVRYNLAVSLAAAGRSDEAIQYYLEAIRLDPDYAEAFNNLGLVLASTRRLEEAAASFSRALQIKPDYAKAHFNLALVFASQGEIEKARASLKTAEKIDPQLAPEVEKQLRLLTEEGS